MYRLGNGWAWDKDGGSGGGAGDDKAAADKAAADKAAADAKGKGGEGGDGEGGEGKPVPYSRFAQVVRERNEVNERLAALEQAQAKQKETDLAKQNEYKTLWEGEKQAHEKTKGEMKAAQEKALRQEVALAKGLPLELSERLKGGTKEEMEADADALLSVVHVDGVKDPTKGIPPKGRGQAAKTFDLDTMSAKEVRENAGKIMEAANSATK